ncbi:hypothetical protein ACP4OV_010429 [Aristida adscensionis]
MESEGLMVRRRSPPVPATLPEDDDLLWEILLRLPPLPRSLPRASLVCKRWRRLLSDPGFLRHFRAFHRRNPTLLGLLVDDGAGVFFTPTLEPPDHVPHARLSMAQPRGEDWHFLGCRHGLALLLSRKRPEISVWDPVTGGQRRVAFPPSLSNGVFHGALLCDDGHAGCHYSKPFKVVLLRPDSARNLADPQVFASLYDSQTGVWSDLISTPMTGLLSLGWPGILVGNSLCWAVLGGEDGGILEFDLERQRLTIIGYPAFTNASQCSSFQILRMEDGRLGFAVLSDGRLQLWVRDASSDGGARWVLQKTIDLQTLLSLSSADPSWIMGYDEDGHAIFVWTISGVFMIQLKSMLFRNLFETNIIFRYHPYSSFYNAAEILELKL